MESRHRVEEFIAAIQSQDIPGALACFTDDAIYRDVTYGTHSGQYELKKMLERMFLEADACWKVHTWIVDARRAAIEWTIDGVRPGVFTERTHRHPSGSFQSLDD